jgi:hypothetical protein
MDSIGRKGNKLTVVREANAEELPVRRRLRAWIAGDGQDAFVCVRANGDPVGRWCAADLAEIQFGLGPLDAIVRGCDPHAVSVPLEAISGVIQAQLSAYWILQQTRSPNVRANAFPWFRSAERWRTREFFRAIEFLTEVGGFGNGMIVQ